jgi:hypothetical protein
VSDRLHSSSLDSGARRSGYKAPPTKRLTATDNDRPENSSPGHLSRGTHLRVCIFLMRYHRIVVTPLPRRPCNLRDTRSRATLPLSQVSNQTVKKKASRSPPFVHFYFGRAAGSATGRLTGRVNARRRDPQTRCGHQSFPDFVLTSSSDSLMRAQRSMRDHASQPFRPPPDDAVEQLPERTAVQTTENASRKSRPCFLRPSTSSRTASVPGAECYLGQRPRFAILR